MRPKNQKTLICKKPALSFSVQPRYFKYKSCKKSDGYDTIQIPRDLMHDIRISASTSRYLCINNLQNKKYGLHAPKNEDNTLPKHITAIMKSQWKYVSPCKYFAHHLLCHSYLFMSPRQPFVERLHTRSIIPFLLFSIQLSLSSFTLCTECFSYSYKGSNKLEAN